MSALKITRLVAWGLVALALAAIAAVVLLRDGPGGPVAATIGGPFSLTDETGRTVTDADLKGHPSALFFGYTFCPDVCPTTLYDMTTWLAALGPDADKLKVYFVTVDPERDTREQLAAYLEAFDPRISGLTGTPAEVAAIVKAYRVYARKVPSESGGYSMDHSAGVYLLDRDAAFTGAIDYQEKEETAVAKLKRLVAG